MKASPENENAGDEEKMDLANTDGKRLEQLLTASNPSSSDNQIGGPKLQNRFALFDNIKNSALEAAKRETANYVVKKLGLSNGLVANGAQKSGDSGQGKGFDLSSIGNFLSSAGRRKRRARMPKKKAVDFAIGNKRSLDLDYSDYEIEDAMAENDRVSETESQEEANVIDDVTDSLEASGNENGKNKIGGSDLPMRLRSGNNLDEGEDGLDEASGSGSGNGNGKTNNRNAIPVTMRYDRMTEKDDDFESSDLGDTNSGSGDDSAEEI